MFHELSLRFGPTLGVDNLTYGGVNLTLRAEVAWSPDASPVGFTVDVSHAR